ncbi:unnamed protein product, partial [Amoebophrya sp. A120]
RSGRDKRAQDGSALGSPRRRVVMSVVQPHFLEAVRSRRGVAMAIVATRRPLWSTSAAEFATCRRIRG